MVTRQAGELTPNAARLPARTKCGPVVRAVTTLDRQKHAAPQWSLDVSVLIGLSTATATEENTHAIEGES